MAKAKVLTRDEIKRVMRIADTGNNGLRDRVALSLSIMAGMRIGEIAALTIGDVRGLDGRAVSVINLSKHQTKGSKSRRVFISAELQKLLNQYLATISKLDDGRACPSSEHLAQIAA
jgi:integrase/recombinase XerD